MVLLIGAIALIFLMINVLIYRRIIASYALGTVEELESLEHHCCCEVIIKYLGVFNEEEAHDPLPETKPSDSYQAWTNRKGIPWIPPAKKPEPIVQAPNRGPLERPDGFI